MRFIKGLEFSFNFPSRLLLYVIFTLYLFFLLTWCETVNAYNLFQYYGSIKIYMQTLFNKQQSKIIITGLFVCVYMWVCVCVSVYCEFINISFTFDSQNNISQLRIWILTKQTITLMFVEGMKYMFAAFL